MLGTDRSLAHLTLIKIAVLKSIFRRRVSLTTDWVRYPFRHGNGIHGIRYVIVSIIRHERVSPLQIDTV